MKQFLHKSPQRGVALLFALGILSVLMILGLAFVSNALIAQKISVNNSYRSQADVLAESAINRVLASTKIYSEYALFGSYQGLAAESLTSRGQADTLFNPAIAKTVGTKFGNLADIAKVLGNVKNSGGFVYVNDTTFTSVGMPDPQWRLVFDSNGRVIGRYAYAVLPYDMFPQIDFTSVHSTMTTPADGITPQQMGFSVPLDATNWYSQFVLGTVPPDVVWRSYSQIFVRQGVSATNQLKVRRFFAPNYPPMIEAFRTIDASKKYTYYHRFNLLRTDWASMTVDKLLGNNAAIFWTAGTKNINTAETEAFPFLARIASVPGTFADLTTRRKQIAANLLEYCINDNSKQAISDKGSWDLTTNIPSYTGNKQTDYLYELGLEISLIKSDSALYTDAGFTVTPNAPANDHDVTYALGVLPIVKLVNMYNNDPVNYKFINSLSSLSITGNVNKCTIEVVYEDDTLPIPVQKTATLQFDIKTENISINRDLAGLPTPTDKMSITAATDSFGYKVQLPAQNFTEGGIRTSNSSPINIKTKNIANLANVKAQRAEATAIVSTKLISIDEVDITSVSATVGNMALFDTGGTLGVDYAKCNLAMSYSTTFQLASNADPNMSYKFALGSLKGIDPRQNLNTGDWDNTTDVGVTTVFNTVNRLDIANVMDVTNDGSGDYTGKCNTNTGANPQNLAATLDFTRDRETVTSPGYDTNSGTTNTMISTAKFPAVGKTLESPAELGYIHRGAKWETINLSNANGAANDTTTINVAAVSSSLDTAGTAYTDGDGGIFDMVKFIDYSTVATPEEKYYTYGKIDLNLVDGNGSSPLETMPGDYMYANWLYQPVLYYTNSYSTPPPAPPIVKAMVPVLNDKAGPRLKTRSEILINNANDGLYNAWGAIVPANMGTKEEMDLLPSYLVNTAEANPVPMMFKAIVKAQSVKDIGPENGDPAAITIMINGTATSITITQGIYDDNADEITGEVSYLVTFVRHPVTNQFFVVDKVQITE